MSSEDDTGQGLEPLAFDGLDGTLVLLTMGPRGPTDTEWNAFLRFLEEREWHQPRVLVRSDGGHPTAAQRARLNTIMSRYPGTKTAVLVNSTLARGAVTAMSWLYGGFQSFAPDQLNAAAVYLDVDDELAAKVRERFDAMWHRVSHTASYVGDSP